MPKTVIWNVFVAQGCSKHVPPRQQSFCRQMCCVCVEQCTICRWTSAGSCHSIRL